jgi:uncharacterized damage-inducible protein DinB
MRAYLSILTEFFERDLMKVREEVNLYEQEEKMWTLCPGINNTAGNLVLHLIGNLNHFIGATIGHSGYTRHRETEFSTRDVSREMLLSMIDNTIEVVNATLANFPEEDLSKDFPLDKHGNRVTNAYMLTHLLTHLNYHLGQINYHRRIICSQSINVHTGI